MSHDPFHLDDPQMNTPDQNARLAWLREHGLDTSLPTDQALDKLRREVAPGISPEDFDVLLDRKFAIDTGATAPAEPRPLTEHLDALKKDIADGTVTLPTDRNREGFPFLPARTPEFVMPSRAEALQSEIDAEKRRRAGF